MKIHLRDIQLSQLNNKSLTLVAKYARVLRVKEGITLKLQDKDILMRVSQTARSTENEELQSLYKELKAQVRICVFDSMK